MASSSKRQRASVPVIPAIPRIFEVKKKAVAPSAQTVEASKLGRDVEQCEDSQPTTISSPPTVPELVDWASLAAEEDPVETPASVSAVELDSAADREPADSKTPKAEVPVNSDLYGMIGERNLEFKHVRSSPNASRGAPPDLAQPENNGYRVEPLQNQHSTPHNHVLQPVMPHPVSRPLGYPPGLAPFPHHHVPQHIAFGSFGDQLESDDSSPILPPSATSTQFTQPTPLSDGHSQTSRAGHGATLSDQVPRGPPFNYHGAHQPNVKIPEQRYGGPELLRLASVTFNDRNRDDLLKSVQQDLFAGGSNELSLKVTTQDGQDSFKIWRAICRRSPELGRLLEQAAVASEASSSEIHSMSSFVTLESVRILIQSLYGSPLVSAEFLESAQTLHFKRPLEIIATGYLLGAGHAVDFGTELALKTLRWEGLPAYFQLCLEGARIDYGHGKPAELTELSSIVHLPRPHCVEILAQSLDCIIKEINSEEGFKFDDHAACFPELAGGFHARPVSVSLPEYGSPQHQANGSSQIQFGNMGNFYRHKHQTLSSILLSLPLVVLQHVLSHVFNLSIVQDVVQEREKRRIFAVKGGVTPYHAHFQESIVPAAEFNGMRVISKRVL